MDRLRKELKYAKKAAKMIAMKVRHKDRTTDVIKDRDQLDKLKWNASKKPYWYGVKRGFEAVRSTRIESLHHGAAVFQKAATEARKPALPAKKSRIKVTKPMAAPSSPTRTGSSSTGSRRRAGVSSPSRARPGPTSPGCRPRSPRSSSRPASASRGSRESTDVDVFKPSHGDHADDSPIAEEHHRADAISRSSPRPVTRRSQGPLQGAGPPRPRRRRRRHAPGGGDHPGPRGLRGLPRGPLHEGRRRLRRPPMDDRSPSP